MNKDLTVGEPQSVLWKFSIPMFVSVIFQQLYNMADSVIAGKFAGEDALAAVGASYPITMIFMAIAVGSNIGCSVIISQYFGAKWYEKMKTAIYTTLIASVALSLLLTAAGLLGSRAMMAAITRRKIFSLTARCTCGSTSAASCFFSYIMWRREFSIPWEIPGRLCTF